MSTLTDEILTTFFKNNRDGTEIIPDSVIISGCKAAGYETSEAEDKLKTLVETHRLSEAGDHYGISRMNSLSLKTHCGTDSTPWQFSLVRTADEIMLTQAKAGPEKFDPVLKRFTIEDQPIDNDDDDYPKQW